MKPAPVQPGERISVIDILRGFAILGILVVNLATYNLWPGSLSSLPWQDRIATWFIGMFAEGKFYTTFSFLFGLGMAIMYLRAEQKGVRFVPIYLRRLLVLLAIGLLHIVLIWEGDILTIYAILGLILLLFFRKARPRTLLIWAVIWIVLVMVLLVGFSVSQLTGMPADEPAKMDMLLQAQKAKLAEANEIYATGTYPEILMLRLSRAGELLNALMALPHLLAMMCLGLYAGKRRIFEDIPAHMPLIRKVWWIGLVIGLAGNLLYVIAGEVQPGNAIWFVLAATVVYLIAAPALSLFYITSFVRLTQDPTWQARLRPLASVGRMAISNYLMQSVICTLIFYGYGLGWYGKVGAAPGLLLTLAIYALQVLFSNYWLKRFRFGPVEWLWRSLTYWRPQSMRIQSGATLPAQES